MELRIGASTSIIASDASVAKEIFKTHEQIFSSRPEFGAEEYSIYAGSSFVTAPYGDYWRFLKKLCMTRLLSTTQLDRFVHIREKEIKRMLKSLMNKSRELEPVDMRLQLNILTSNTICLMAMSTRCSDNSNEANEILSFVKEVTELAGKLALGDAFGPLKRFNFFGRGEDLVSVLRRFDKLVEGILKEHEVNGSNGREEDLMDILLEVQKDPSAEVKLSRNNIKGFLLDIFMGGSDTASVAMQWIMAELINHPQIFKKLRQEINSVVGTERLVKESDVPNLPYLRAVIKESLRLHPSVPLILRQCTEDCKINGYDVKAKSRIMVNAYAIMRDPSLWKDPNEFVPERFLMDSDEKIGEHVMETKGQNFRFLPFGSGRRGCPGSSFALTVMHATVGALVQCFDWKTKGVEKLDMKMGPGFAGEMGVPLVCYPITHFNPLD